MFITIVKSYIWGRRADVDIDREFSLHPGVLYSGVLTIRGFTIRGSYNQWSYNHGSCNQGFLQSGVLTIRSSYNQGFTSVYLTWHVWA